jgi:hypothetical protein
MHHNEIYPKTADSQAEDLTCHSQRLLQWADQDMNLMKTVITSDVAWVCGYNPETKPSHQNEDFGISEAKWYTKFRARWK